MLRALLVAALACAASIAHAAGTYPDVLGQNWPTEAAANSSTDRLVRTANAKFRAKAPQYALASDRWRTPILTGDISADVIIVLWVTRPDAGVIGNSKVCASLVTSINSWQEQSRLPYQGAYAGLRYPLERMGVTAGTCQAAFAALGKTEPSADVIKELLGF